MIENIFDTSNISLQNKSDNKCCNSVYNIIDIVNELKQNNFNRLHDLEILLKEADSSIIYIVNTRSQLIDVLYEQIISQKADIVTLIRILRLVISNCDTIVLKFIQSVDFLEFTFKMLNKYYDVCDIQKELFEILYIIYTSNPDLNLFDLISSSYPKIIERIINASRFNDQEMVITWYKMIDILLPNIMNNRYYISTIIFNICNIYFRDQVFNLDLIWTVMKKLFISKENINEFFQWPTFIMIINNEKIDQSLFCNILNVALDFEDEQIYTNIKKLNYSILDKCLTYGSECIKLSSVKIVSKLLRLYSQNKYYELEDKLLDIKGKLITYLDSNFNNKLRTESFKTLLHYYMYLPLTEDDIIIILNSVLLFVELLEYSSIDSLHNFMISTKNRLTYMPKLSDYLKETSVLNEIRSLNII